MEIAFRTKKLRKTFESGKELAKTYGPQQAKKIKMRITELEAAATLADVPTEPPPRCHPLKGDRKGEYAVDLKHPWRLVFRPEELPSKDADGNLDLSTVTSIIITNVEDYH